MQLENLRIAILATDGFEQDELMEPRKALEDAGAKTEIVSPRAGSIKGWKHSNWGEAVSVDKTVADSNASDYDALVLPGGVMNPDKLRTNSEAVNFVAQFVQAGKPIAAICHGPWTLIEADAVRGRTLTSWPSLKTDLKNAGASWVDREVVVDKGIITSRKPDDLPAFNKAILEELAKKTSSKKKLA